MTPAGLGYLSTLAALGTTREGHRDVIYSRTGLMDGLGSLGDTAPGITGIAAVDQFLYTVEGKLTDFQTAMTVTTISSLAAAICGVLLIMDRKR